MLHGVAWSLNEMGGYGVLFVDTLYNMGRCIVTYRIREDIKQKNGYSFSKPNKCPTTAFDFQYTLNRYRLKVKTALLLTESLILLSLP